MKPSFVLSLFGVFFAYLLFPIHVGAWTEVPRPGVDEQVSAVANVMAVTDSEAIVINNHSSGMRGVIQCKLYGEVMKGSALFPVGMYDKTKPAIIYMVDMSASKGPPPCKNGMSGVVMFFDPSLQLGLTSFLRQGMYLEQTVDGKKVMTKGLYISNPTTKNLLLQRNPSVGKALRMTSADDAQAPGGFTKDSVVEGVRAVINLQMDKSANGQ